MSAQASAATYVFTLSGNYTASWQLNSSPTPDTVGPFRFELNNVAGTYGGVAAVASRLIFYTSVDGGGLRIDLTPGAGTVIASGPQLFGGTTAMPTFSPGGPYLLVDTFGQGRYSLTIAEATAAVPEPASWAMMVIGFGLVGGAVRSGRRSGRLAVRQSRMT